MEALGWMGWHIFFSSLMENKTNKNRNQQTDNNRTTTENKQTRSATLARHGRGTPPASPRAHDAPPARQAGALPPAPTLRALPLAAPARADPARPPARRFAHTPDPGGRELRSTAARPGAPAAGPAWGGAPAQPGWANRLSGPSRHTARRSGPGDARESHSCHEPLTATGSRAGPPLTWLRADTAPTPPGRACAAPCRGTRTSLPAQTGPPRKRKLAARPPGRTCAQQSRPRRRRAPAGGVVLATRVRLGCARRRPLWPLLRVVPRAALCGGPRWRPAAGAWAPRRRRRWRWAGKGFSGTPAAGSAQQPLPQALGCCGDWREEGEGCCRCARGHGCTQGLSGRRACQYIGSRRPFETRPTTTVRDMSERSIFTEKGCECSPVGLVLCGQASV